MFEGKRAAWANLLLRMGAVLVIVPFFYHYIDLQHAINVLLLEKIIGNPASVHWEIALTHFFFNLAVALIFLPLLPLGKKIVCWLFPAKPSENEEIGWKEICEMHQGTMEMLDLTLASLASGNRELARKMKHHHQYYGDRTDQLKRSHLMRLSEGLKESIETSQIHMELISLLNQINHSLLLSASHLLPDKEITQSEPLAI